MDWCQLFCMLWCAPLTNLQSCPVRNEFFENLFIRLFKKYNKSKQTSLALSNALSSAKRPIRDLTNAESALRLALNEMKWKKKLKNWKKYETKQNFSILTNYEYDWHVHLHWRGLHVHWRCISSLPNRICFFEKNAQNFWIFRFLKNEKRHTLNRCRCHFCRQ